LGGGAVLCDIRCLLPPAYAYAVRLDDHSIAFHTGFSERSLDRASIVARRIQPYQYCQVLELLTDATGARSLKIPLLLRFDADFEVWLASLRDLDAEEKGAVLADLASSHDERSIARARMVARTLTGAVVIGGLWVFFFPRPYTAATAVNLMLPLIGLLVLARGRGLYSLDASRNDPRPSVAAALVLPGLIVMVRLVMDVSLLRPMQLVAPALALAVLLSAVAVRSDPRASRWMLLLFPLVLIAYTGSAVVWANCALDRSQPQSFQSRIASKYVHHGKVTTYELVLGPWGPVRTSESTNVPRPVYERVEEGQAVRVVLHEGRLGMPWFKVVP
jgi:hypothetical protein